MATVVQHLAPEDPVDDLDPGGRRIYFGYYMVGAALAAQFIAIGAQASVSGVFFDPMIDDLGWTRAEFTCPDHQPLPDGLRRRLDRRLRR